MRSAAALVCCDRCSVPQRDPEEPEAAFADRKQDESGPEEEDEEKGLSGTSPAFAADEGLKRRNDRNDERHRESCG